MNSENPNWDSFEDSTTTEGTDAIQPPPPPPPPRKVIRFSALKRNRESAPVNDRVKLERVLGFTISGSASLSCDVRSGSIVYPAGCVIVLYNLRKNRQTHILNASKKTVTALDVSSDGKYVVTGECGHLPNVRVWDVLEKVQVAEFTGHKFGINCVAFSPNLKHVVSVGSQHDMIVNVWDWKSGVKVASNKVSSKVKAVDFSESGNYFVTVGNRHVKFWYLECSARPSKYKEPVPLMGRSAILGEQRNNYFCDVACGRGDIATSTFSITKSGLLCEFNSRRLLDKWVELRTASANCLCVGNDFIFIGCSDGIVRCFNPYTLDYITTLPRTHSLGVDVAMGLSISHMAAQKPNAKFPDTVAIAMDELNHKLTCVYSDHSMYIWDVTDIKKVGKSHSFLYHSACIWGVEVYPRQTEGTQKAALPSGSFVTCSSDDTIRVWNLEPNLPSSTMYRRNIYSNELLKTVYVDETLNYLCDLDRNPGGSNDKMDATYDTKNGVRCIHISPDGQQLASGDRSGNIRIHELHRMEEVCKIEAHDSEVLNLEFSKPDTGHRFLASASRDRLIHVFDVDQDYAFQQTLDDHSSSITAVRFVKVDNRMQMISCGADKSIIFRTAQFLPQLQLTRDHHVVGRTTLYDMEVDPEQKCVLTACQDRHVRVYAVGSGKHIRSFKGSFGEDGTLIKVVLDSSGTYAVTSCTDKNLCLFDFATGECVATVYGHSELVTGLKFTNDCKHLISVSGDGCIFLWKLPLELTQQMHLRLAQMAPKSAVKLPRKSVVSQSDFSKEEFGPAHNNVFDSNANEVDDGGVPDYRFSIGPLPKWAKKEISDSVASSLPSREKVPGILQPKGRWAQRIDTQGLVVRSFYSSDHVIPYPGQIPAQTCVQRSEESIRRETILVSKTRNIHDPSSDFVPCPDSIDEICRMAPSSPGPFVGVSTRKGSSVSEISTLSRQRLVTDSSSASSHVHGDDFEGEHDADVEDEESIETDHSAEMDVQETIYYPHAGDSMDACDGEFKVCATNPDELREAHRRMRKGRAERPLDLPIVNVQDSDEDEEATTPQGSTDRSMLSMLNVSMESLDRVGQREKFIKSNFESLDVGKGGETGRLSLSPRLGVNGNDDEDDDDDHRHSLSARYLNRPGQETPLRNVAVLNASKQRNEASSQRRQEIMKQIEQTRRKLDTIGFKASMNSSKSIGDLTDLPEKDSYGGRYFSSNKDPNSIQDAIRRASSMSDLSKPRRLLAPPPTEHVSNRRPTTLESNSRPMTSISRSSSMGTLNPSESDNESTTGGTRGDGGGQQGSTTNLSRWNSGSSMKPTISSRNKSVGAKGSQEQLGSRPSAGARPPHVPPGGGRRVTDLNVDKRKTLDAKRNGESSSGECSPTDTRPPFRTMVGSGGGFTTATLPRNHGRSSVANRSSLGYSSNRSRSEKDLTKVGTNTAGRAKSASSSYGCNGVNSGSSHSSMTNGGVEDVGFMLEKSPQELPVKDNLPETLDVASAPLGRGLCDWTAQTLKLAADNVLQLYKRVTMDSDLLDSERVEMLNVLCESVSQAQQTLRPVNPGGVGGYLSSHLSSLGSLSKGGGGGGGGMDLDPSQWKDSTNAGPDHTHLLQQYSDMLLSLVQQRMGPSHN